MAERDQLRGALGSHDARDAGGAEHVALLGVAGHDQVKRRPGHDNASFRDREPLARGLIRHVTIRASPEAPIWVRAGPVSDLDLDLAGFVALGLRAMSARARRARRR